MKPVSTLIVGCVVLPLCMFSVSRAQLRGHPFRSNSLHSSASRQDSVAPPNTNQPSGNHSSMMKPSFDYPDDEPRTTEYGDSITSLNETSDLSNTTKQVQNHTDEGGEPIQCLRMTFNNTKQVYKLPLFESPGYDYKLWFKPLKGEEAISIQFDFSLHGTVEEFGGHVFSYVVNPLQWHKLEIVSGRYAPTSCRRWAELKITGIDVEECLPHHTISRIQVSSAENLVLWSSCPPQGQWWDEMTMTVITAQMAENSVPASSSYVLATFLAVALVGLVVVGAYAWHLRSSQKRGKFQDYFTLEEKKPGV